MRKGVAVLLLLFCASIAVAQQQMKAVWEPVNYPEDLELNGVFFVTDQEGWITGGRTAMRGGVILHTSDGGDHWDVQVGDPNSADHAFHSLRFIDPTHGWAAQRTGSSERLLHTTDGVNWQLAGTIKENFTDYQFTSDSDGVVAHREDIYATHDGGRTWSPVFKCHSRVEVNGLTREMRCEIVSLQFVTPQTGYAIGHAEGTHLDAVFVARTDDGGQSWNVTTSPVTGQAADAFFIDERTGYLRTGAPDSGQLFKTSDGGATWQGLAGSPGNRIAFADPEVGWAVYSRKVSFTHDGGGHWNSREYPFPASVKAFSLPRRDRGYVVGDHGMIYRYRVVPVSYAAKGLIEAPRLAPIDFTVPSELQKLSAQAQALQAPPDSAANGAPPAAAPPATQIAPVENTLNAVAAQIPGFVSRYRNLNLLMVGLQMTSSVPQQIVDLKAALTTIKSGTDATARATAIADFSTKLQGLVTFMNTNFHSPLLSRKK